MRQLSMLAQIYLMVVFVSGLAACLWLLTGVLPPVGVTTWLLAVGFAIVAGACQAFSARRTATDQGDPLTLAPLFAALLLLPYPLFALVLIATVIPAWVLSQRRWFVKVFTLAAYMLVGAAGAGVLMFLPDAAQGPRAWTVLVTAGLVLLLVQTVLQAGIFVLVRGEPLLSSGLFAPRRLLVGGALLAVGFGFVVGWQVQSIFGLIAALPLALFFQAVQAPSPKGEALTDTKTGLANMRHFNMVLARELERAEQSNQALSLLVCDLDYLRNINSTYGHQAGDVVLMGIADIIRRNIRGSDIAARFSGEEFVILLCDQARDDALVVAERMRRELEESRFEAGPDGQAITATMSIGVAAYPIDGRTIETLTREAELAVYKAKRDGHNCVVQAGRATRELAGEWAREHLAPLPVAMPLRKEQRRHWSFPVALLRARVVPKPDVQGKAPAAGPPLSIGLLIALVFVGGMLSLWPDFQISHALSWGIVLFAALCIVVEQLAVDISGRGKTSVAVVAVLAASFLFGGAGILAAATALSVSVAIKARSPLHRVLFNIGNVVLSAQGAYFFFALFAGIHLDVTHGPLLIIPAGLAGLLYYAINHALLSLIRGVHEGRSPWQIWQADYRWLWPHYALMGVLGLGVALAYLTMGTFGVLAMALPVSMMHIAFKQYTVRTTMHVEDLRCANARLADSYEATLQALTRALDTRDEETEEHSQRVRRYAGLIAQQLNLSASECEDIARGALLHDIGKIGVPDAILLKPGKLNDEERAMMRKHPEIGYAMIAHIPFLSNAAQVVLHHHEAFDGSGYPSGLAGENIPLGARIFAVADTFDAMTSDRPYRAALSIDVAFAEIRRCQGVQFDPAIVAAFFGIAPEALITARSHREETSLLGIPGAQALAAA